MTNKGYWGDISKQRYLNSSDKDAILEQLTLIRDAPSEEKYKEAEDKFLEMTADLHIRPGQSNSAVRCPDYYHKNWKEEDFRWVKVYRKNLPIGNTNDTNASESTFSFIKRAERKVFNGKKPSLEDLLRLLPKWIDDRTLSRKTKQEAGKRFVIRDSDPAVQAAYDAASWKLKSSGMNLFRDCVDWAKARLEHMTFDGDSITEKFTGKRTRDYTGHYTSDGLKCNCSHYSTLHFLRWVWLDV